MACFAALDDGNCILNQNNDGCRGRPNGHYHSCWSCHNYFTCSNYNTYTRLCNPRSYVFDDNAKKCLQKSSTCTLPNLFLSGLPRKKRSVGTSIERLSEQSQEYNFKGWTILVLGALVGVVFVALTIAAANSFLKKRLKTLHAEHRC
ncbi:uncharacterized protein LOC130054311 [Ostrea edulis]|uniref:uncharacterized protein LOC130054311 n=1 Tax=Ostrea edulis TaxID=37623 RepID=UPI0024AF35C2|nr:uncharacterized protein LOC130054311 [Ostrea edulis]